MVTKRKRFGAILVLLLPAVAAMAMVIAGSPGESDQARRPATGTQGMVSSAHPLATEAGLEILRGGGNAFDAAVAVAATLNVVEPMMSGMGGYGTILVYSADENRTRFLNCSGRIPANLDSDVFRAPTPSYKENRTGPLAVSTPGNANCWEAMSKTYGRREWKDLFGTAIRTAEEGFVADGRTAAMVARGFPDFPAHAKEFYGSEGSPLSKGDLLVQADLGRSLQRIATEGAGVLHGGELGQALAGEVAQRGGVLSLKDLAENEAEWWEPISIRIGEYDVYTASPPATAFPSLIRLGMMSQLHKNGEGGGEAPSHNSADYLHYFAEISKHAFWARLRYAGDPDVEAPPLEMLLSEEYWKEQNAKIEPGISSEFVPPGADDSVTPDSHTTHFVVADKWGNVVSATQTLGNLFGSRIMAEGTGIWLNNSLAYSTFEPKGNAMDAFAGRHKSSGDCPTIILKEGRPWAALGTSGGHTIGQTVPQMVLNLTMWGRDIQEAIDLPRVSFVEPDFLAVEAGVPQAVRDQLKGYGHKVRSERLKLGNAHGLSIEYDGEGRPAHFFGAADRRGAGVAKGLN